VADTVGGIHQTGFPLDQGQHPMFRTGLHTTATSNALVDVDSGMLRQCWVRTLRSSIPYLFGQFPIFGRLDRPVPNPKYTEDGAQEYSNSYSQSPIHQIGFHSAFIVFNILLKMGRANALPIFLSYRDRMIHANYDHFYHVL